MLVEINPLQQGQILMDVEVKISDDINNLKCYTLCIRRELFHKAEFILSCARFTYQLEMLISLTSTFVLLYQFYRSFSLS